MRPERSALGVKYCAMLLRVLIIVAGVKMILLGNGSFSNPPFVSGLGILLIGLYLALQSFVGPKAMLCPFGKKCREKMGCKSEK